MSPNMNALNSRSVNALSISGNETDHIFLQKIFTGTRLWKLHQARSFEEALRCLDQHQLQVVISDSRIPQGSWKEVLQALDSRPNPPMLVVTARCADERLWAEALNCGAYDVLARPLDGDEVTRVVDSAVRHFEAARKN